MIHCVLPRAGNIERWLVWWLIISLFERVMGDGTEIPRDLRPGTAVPGRGTGTGTHFPQPTRDRDSFSRDSPARLRDRDWKSRECGTTKSRGTRDSPAHFCCPAAFHNPAENTKGFWFTFILSFKNWSDVFLNADELLSEPEYQI